MGDFQKKIQHRDRTEQKKGPIYHLGQEMRKKSFRLRAASAARAPVCAPLVSVFPTAVVPRSCAVWEGPVPCSVLSSVRTLESGPLSSTLSSPPPPPAISRDAQTVSRGRP